MPPRRESPSATGEQKCGAPTSTGWSSNVPLAGELRHLYPHRVLACARGAPPPTLWEPLRVGAGNPTGKPFGDDAVMRQNGAEKKWPAALNITWRNRDGWYHPRIWSACPSCPHAPARRSCTRARPAAPAASERIRMSASVKPEGGARPFLQATSAPAAKNPPRRDKHARRDFRKLRLTA